MARYVPKTYNNRRGLRIIIGVVTAIALSVVILFLILFLILQGYVVDGQLEIPWLLNETVPTPPPVADGEQFEDPSPAVEPVTDEPVVETATDDDLAEETATDDPAEETATGDEHVE